MYKRQLVELVAGYAAPALPAPPVAAITASREVDVDDWADLIADATTAEECRAIWRNAKDAGALPLVEQRIKDRAAEIAASQVAVGPQSGVESGTGWGFDPDTNIDDLWFLVVGAAGRQGMSDADVRERFARDFGHSVDEGTPAEMQALLADLQAGVA